MKQHKSAIFPLLLTNAILFCSISLACNDGTLVDDIIPNNGYYTAGNRDQILQGTMIFFFFFCIIHFFFVCVVNFEHTSSILYICDVIWENPSHVAQDETAK